MSLLESIIQYFNARYPILYIESFEETKVDRIIAEAMKKVELTHGYEWNAATGYCDFFTKSPDDTEISLAAKLKSLADESDAELDKSFLVIKDSNQFMDDPIVVGSLKKLLLRIVAEQEETQFDFVIFIVSSVRKIPAELEKYITMLELEFPNEDEIETLIKAYDDRYILGIPAETVKEMALACKGLTEFESENVMALVAGLISGQSSADSVWMIPIRNLRSGRCVS